MIYFTFILQFIWFVVSIALCFIKDNVLYLVVAAIIPFNALSTYFYYKKKRKELTDKNTDKMQEK
jgi:ABC-type bacteriocin/lantibiotic exporter with double-glycine peptidase domain